MKLTLAILLLIVVCILMPLIGGGLAIFRCQPDAIQARHMTLANAYVESACKEIQMVYLHGLDYYIWKPQLPPVANATAQKETP